VGIESPEQMAVHRQSGAAVRRRRVAEDQVDEWTGQRRGLLRLPGRDIRLIEGSTLR
jgi:hypothetical protein